MLRILKFRKVKSNAMQNLEEVKEHVVKVSKLIRQFKLEPSKKTDSWQLCESICETLDPYWKGNVHNYATPWHGFLKVRLGNRAVAVPHTCILVKWEGQVFFVDPIVSQFKHLIDKRISSDIYISEVASLDYYNVLVEREQYKFSEELNSKYVELEDITFVQEVM